MNAVSDEDELIVCLSQLLAQFYEEGVWIVFPVPHTPVTEVFVLSYYESLKDFQIRVKVFVVEVLSVHLIDVQLENLRPLTRIVQNDSIKVVQLHHFFQIIANQIPNFRFSKVQNLSVFEFTSLPGCPNAGL